MIPSLLAVTAVVITMAGVPGTPGHNDGAANVALFNKPTEIALDGQGKVYVVDRLNNAVRIVSASGVVSTYALERSFPSLNFGGPMGGGIVIEPPGVSRFLPYAPPRVFIASSGTHVILQPDTYGAATTHDFFYVGKPGVPGYADIAGEYEISLDKPRFNTPTALAIDRRRYPLKCCGHREVFIADTANGAIRKMTRVPDIEDEYGTAEINTVAGGFVAPRGLAFGPDGSLYVADAGQHAIVRILPDGTSFVVAGKPFVPGNADGVPGMLNTPTGLDVDDAGNLYIADTGNSTIRRLTAAGVLETIAGSPGESGFADGDARLARFNGPVGVQVAPDGSLIVADTSNHVIRKITFTAPPPPTPRHRGVRH